MKWFFFAILVVHGLIHFMGFSKAFNLGEFQQLTQPISKGMGLVWLAAGLAVLTAGVLFIVGVEWWWILGAVAVVCSQVLVISGWSDAKFGTVANVLMLVGVVYGFFAQGPLSFRAEYRDRVRAQAKQAAKAIRVAVSKGKESEGKEAEGKEAEGKDAEGKEAEGKEAEGKDADTGDLLTEGDISGLPEPVRCYIRQSGAVGRPRVRHFKAVWKGRIRQLKGDPWMEFTAQQVNFIQKPSRFFLMDATRSGLPVDVLHVFCDGHASMRVKLVSILPLVDARGPEMDRAETVTLLNDICLMAPGALVSSSIRWESVDDSTAKAHFTHGANTISAVLTFNKKCELINFVTDDRLRASADGKEFKPVRWSTPVKGYKKFGPFRAFSKGEGRWHPSDGEYAYFEAELMDLEINGKVP